MPCYAGLDVAQRDTQLCIIDPHGTVLWTGKVATEPDALDRALRAHAQGLVRAVLETGALANWLASRLLAAGHPIICIDARAAHGALRGRSKSDRGDAEGLARLAQTGWFKAVRLKSQESLEQHALLVARERLVRIRCHLLNQIRGLMKPLGLVPETGPGELRHGW